MSSTTSFPLGWAAPTNPGVRAKGSDRHLAHRRLSRGGFNSRDQACRSAAGKIALHFAHPPAHPRRGPPELGSRLLFEKEDSQIKRDGVEATRKHHAGAGCFRGIAVFTDHRRHPGRFPAQVHIVGSGLGTGRYKALAVKLIGPDRRNDHLGVFRHGFQRSWIGRIGGDQRETRRSADEVAYLGEFPGVSPGHRPLDFARCAIGAEQMFGHQSTGKAGRAVDDKVVGARERLFGIGHDGVLHRRGRLLRLALTTPSVQRLSVEGWSTASGGSTGDVLPSSLEKCAKIMIYAQIG